MIITDNEFEIRVKIEAMLEANEGEINSLEVIAELGDGELVEKILEEYLVD